jgi:glutathionylspermidine synthase
MRRIACEERTDWRATAERVGFLFHANDGDPYWDERAYYGFTLQQIERDLEAPTAELDAMCRELVARAVKDERILRALQIPERYWTFIAASLRRNEPSLYGRFDLSYDGNGPAKLLEYNADTPTSVYETAVFQWMWLEEAIARQIVPRDADQYNSLHERLIAAWKGIGQGRHVHLAGVTESAEDLGTLAYLEDTARQAGLTTTILAIGDMGRTPKGQFVDRDDRPIEIAFKLYPWEWMFREEFGASLAGASTRWIEPPWKAILSNKGILPLLWEMFPRHPNLLPAYFDVDPEGARLGGSFVKKPLYRAKAPMSRSWSAAPQSTRTAGRMGRKVTCGRRSRRCRGSTRIMRCSARGWRPGSRAACRCVRMRARSPRTPRVSCRMQ